MPLEMGDPNGEMMGQFSSQKSHGFPGEYEVINWHRLSEGDAFFVRRHLTQSQARYLARKPNGGRDGERARQANFDAWFVSEFLPSRRKG